MIMYCPRSLARSLMQTMRATCRTDAGRVSSANLFCVCAAPLRGSRGRSRCRIRKSRACRLCVGLWGEAMFVVRRTTR
jgi:hypothetical protein